MLLCWAVAARICVTVLPAEYIEAKKVICCIFKSQVKGCCIYVSSDGLNSGNNHLQYYEFIYCYSRVKGPKLPL